MKAAEGRDHVDSLSTIPASAIVPTRDRSDVLRRTLESLLHQMHIPQELIVIDASRDDSSRQVVQWFAAISATYGGHVTWKPANNLGAAAQRNEGLEFATQEVVWFFDDDILFKPDCVNRLWRALERDPLLGGVSAMIVNQSYHPPGNVSRLLFQIMAGHAEPSYAGRVLGPAVNLLPEDRDDLPDVVPVEWLNLGCTLYRRKALPQPPFPAHFTGYSLMEDVTLSLIVGRRWKLANARNARIYHDSQPGEHKADNVNLARMSVVNRYYVMSVVLGRRRPTDIAKLILWELSQLGISAIQQRAGTAFWQTLWGRILGACDIFRRRIEDGRQA